MYNNKKSKYKTINPKNVGVTVCPPGYAYGYHPQDAITSDIAEIEEVLFDYEEQDFFIEEFSKSTKT